VQQAMIDKKVFELRQRWHLMSNELHFDIVSPFILEYDGHKLECFAFLPKFGSKNGMIIDLIFPPEYATNKQISNACKRLGLYCSFINYESYAGAQTETFCETLNDWGYFGQPDDKHICDDE
jgi:hypothetical protein